MSHPLTPATSIFLRAIGTSFLVGVVLLGVGCKEETSGASSAVDLQPSNAPKPFACPEGASVGNAEGINSDVCLPTDKYDRRLAIAMLKDLQKRQGEMPKQAFDARVGLFDYLPVTKEVDFLESTGAKVVQLWFWMLDPAELFILDIPADNTTKLHTRIAAALLRELAKVSPGSPESYSLKKAQDLLAQDALNIHSIHLEGTAREILSLWLEHPIFIRGAMTAPLPELSGWSPPNPENPLSHWRIQE